MKKILVLALIGFIILAIGAVEAKKLGKNNSMAGNGIHHNIGSSHHSSGMMNNGGQPNTNHHANING